MSEVQILDAIYWVGINDRKSPFFERMWPLPNGVAYNSYLILDQKTALIDAALEGIDDGYLERIEALLQGKPLDYLVINHMEPDHTSLIPAVLARHPGVKIVGNKMTRTIFSVYFPGPVDFLEVKEGDTIELGQRQLRFILTPGVHWPETMMTYVPSDQLLFSGDAFGSFGALDGSIFDDGYPHAHFEDEMLRYYVSVVSRYSNMVQKALAKLSGLSIAIIASTHGPIWRSNPQYVVDCYDRWSRQQGESGVAIAVASMYGATMQLGEHLAHRLAQHGVRRVAFHDVSLSELSVMTRDIWRYRGLVLGSVAYNTEMYPKMAHLCAELRHVGLSNKVLGLFGGCSWSGGGLKGLMQFAEEAKLPLTGEPFEMKGRHIGEAELAKADALAQAIASALEGA